MNDAKLFLFMTFAAVLRFLYIERFLPVMALSAKISLGQLAHVHLVGPLGHLEHMVMTARALQALRFYMQFVAEHNFRCPPGFEGEVAAAYFISRCRQWCDENEQNDTEQCHVRLHFDSPLYIFSKRYLLYQNQHNGAFVSWHEMLPIVATSKIPVFPFSSQGFALWLQNAHNAQKKFVSFLIGVIDIQRYRKKISTDRLEYSLQQGRGRGRAAGNAGVNRNDVADSAQGRIAFPENAARTSAVTHGNYDLRCGRGMVGPLERNFHVVGNRTRHQQHVRKTRRRGEVDAEALAVVKGVVQAVDLELAAVSRPRIHLPDRQAAFEAPADHLLELHADLLDPGIGDRRDRLRDDARAEYLPEDSDHKTSNLRIE
jgi:hypothetical protein